MLAWRLDQPRASRPHRVYVALTNHCNRSCPWCSTCSSRAGSTYLDPDMLLARLPRARIHQVQLEGGEPTLHPDFLEIVRMLRRLPSCERIVVATNGTTLPRHEKGLRDWVLRLGSPLTLKVSVNHHLIDCDAAHVERVARLRDVVSGMGRTCELVVNVRLRKGEDRHVLESIRAHGLEPQSNVFLLQRYGFASDREHWPLPAPVTLDFTLVNPDGSVHGSDLMERSEAMRSLP